MNFDVGDHDSNEAPLYEYEERSELRGSTVSRFCHFDSRTSVLCPNAEDLVRWDGPTSPADHSKLLSDAARELKRTVLIASTRVFGESRIGGTCTLWVFIQYQIEWIPPPDTPHPLDTGKQGLWAKREGGRRAR